MNVHIIKAANEEISSLSAGRCWNTRVAVFPYFTTFIFLFQNIRDILLIGHRQAVAWLDEWHGQSDARTPESA